MMFPGLKKIPTKYLQSFKSRKKSRGLNLSKTCIEHQTLRDLLNLTTNSKSIKIGSNDSNDDVVMYEQFHW